MRQVHRAGEKTFIDFSGKRPTLVDRRTGEPRPVELFVAVLGASSFTYVEATETQQLPDCEHNRAVARPVLTPCRTDFVSLPRSVGPAGQHASRRCLAGRQ